MPRHLLMVALVAQSEVETTRQYEEIVVELLEARLQAMFASRGRCGWRRLHLDC